MEKANALVEKAAAGDSRGLERLLQESYGDVGFSFRRYDNATLDATIRAVRVAQVRRAAHVAAHYAQVGTLRLLLRHGEATFTARVECSVLHVPPTFESASGDFISSNL